MKKLYMKVISSFICLIIMISPIITAKAQAEELNINAMYAIALDSKSKVVLYNKNAYMLVPMASTTKIMTALVALKYGDLDKKIEISSKSAGIHGSTVGYKKNEQITLKELIFGLMLRSGNDAAIAIAEGIGGDVEGFAKLMNEYSAQIGLCNTHFQSPHGLDSDEHYTSAYDLALVTAKAREIPLFNEIVQSKDVDKKTYGFTRDYHNINKILWQLPNASGVKTGFTGKAGKCLVTSVNIKGNDVIIVVLNSSDRWNVTKKINDYVQKKYEYKKLFSKGDIVSEITICDKSSEKVRLYTDEDIILPVRSDASYHVQIVKPKSVIKGGIKKDDKLGSLCVLKDNEAIYTISLKAKDSCKSHKFIKNIY
ncbi:D-alanyl-D-alanine carboxypeptidase family protein [Clostridium omnivorum]|uniref:serine-type D-Ala-D-Ala carboxypeptidase n=1 Tax=Clostridium omnivorum TaxID=1604902 RepID=A0ABQ5NB71_9CLOT|nr:D-alanyl-D-alanine carboxypeptidase [Clostridium sp. E14]